MGISKGGYALLCELKRDTLHLGSSILQLGRQHTFVTTTQLLKTYRRFGLSCDISPMDFNSQRPGYVDDLKLFRTLGFSTVHSLDASDFEGATYVHDLNKPVASELAKTFDVIYDGGTTEHIFSVPTVLQNIFTLLKEEGVVIHHSPSHNHVDHGFYMFSPMFFYEWYRANSWEILKSYIIEYGPNHNGKSWVVRRYEPGAIDQLSFGGWGSEMLAIWLVAKKTTSSTCDVIPQQGIYKTKWERARSQEQPADSKFRLKYRGILIELLTKNYVIMQSATWVHNKMRRLRKPPIVSRY
jgi:SAM-dependent methyltransferase